MNIEHFRQLLLEKERELLTHSARLANDANDTHEAGRESGDYADVATASEETDVVLAAGERETHLLADIRAALQRIKDGTYGKCIECGKPIEKARLEAVPWTEYCLTDQERRDAATGRSETGPTL